MGRDYKRGLPEGKLTVLLRQIEKRFGAIPDWVEQRLSSRTLPELEDLSVRLLDAQSLEDLLQ